MTTVARIGVLVPAGNPTVEPEFYRMAPSSVTVHFARFESPEGTTPGTHVGMEQRLLGYLDAMPPVIPSLAAVHPTVVALAHTSVSYAVGLPTAIVLCLARRDPLKQAGILNDGAGGRHLQGSGISNGWCLVFVLGAANAMVGLWEFHEAHSRKRQIGSGCLCSLTDLEREPPKRDEIGSRRESKIHVDTARDGVLYLATDSPAVVACGIDS
jgi:hypothetical protein